MRRYPVLLLFGANTIGLAAAWWAGARLGWIAATICYVATIALLITVIAVLARLTRRAEGE